MKGLARQGARDRPVRADDPQIESQLLHNGQGKSVAASRDHDDFDPFRMGPAQGRHIGGRDLKFRVQQSAVDIDGQQTDGRLHCKRF